VNLRALRAGDAGEWDEAFRRLWPVAYAAAQAKLRPFLPGEIEDVAIETMEALVDTVRDVAEEGDLEPLVAGIAHHRAVSLLRARFAKKRSVAVTEPIGPAPSGGQAEWADPAIDSPLAALEQKELAERLSKTLSELRPPQGPILTDLFLNGLSHEEVARKRGIPVGSVGVYRQRGLETLRRIWRCRDES
jgi:RNA polymerase sigma-70 factor, ECF subfamily